MKTRLNALTKYFGTMYKRLEASRNWQHAFLGERSMIGYLNRLPILLLGSSGRTWILALIRFSRFALKTRKHMGFKGLAITLKVMSTMVIKAIAKRPIDGNSLGMRVASSGGGLPTLIPSVHRKAIRRGNVQVIKFWLSLFSIYRILEYKGKLNLKTITRPGIKFKLNPYKSFIWIFFKRMGYIPMVPQKWEPKIITKSGPGVVAPTKGIQPPWSIYNTTTAMIVTAVALTSKRFESLLEQFKIVAHATGQTSLVDMLQRVGALGSAIPIVTTGGRVGENFKGIVTEKLTKQLKSCSFVPVFLGRLGAKEEPGKVRVFAMVDWWTQMLLRPIHLMLFAILKRIPQDATFDQEQGVQRGRSLLKESRYAGSFDLSAATDRLPVSLQSLLIEHLLPGCGEAWRRLLVDREYSTPVLHRRIGMKVPESVTYSVGQPMGALSSWAMLALTHHFIVQYSAWKEGWPRWFTAYLVLGDDIVIFNKDVARRYLVIMKDLGVGINLVKSVVSTDTFEFAKRIIHLDSDLSPVSFKELDVASLNLEGALLLFNKFAPEWTIASMVKFRGYKYRTTAILDHEWAKLATHLKNLLVFCAIPGTSHNSKSSWYSWFTSISTKDQAILTIEESQSLWDKIKVLFISTRPYGWDPQAMSAYTGYFQSDKTSIWFPTGLEELPHWRVEELTWLVHGLMYPVKSDFQLANKLSDEARGPVEELAPAVMKEEEFNTFFNAFIAWDVESSLVPKERTLNVYRQDDLPKARVGRWLKWHSATRA